MSLGSDARQRGCPRAGFDDFGLSFSDCSVIFCLLCLGGCLVLVAIVREQDVNQEGVRLNVLKSFMSVLSGLSFSSRVSRSRCICRADSTLPVAAF